MICKAFLYERNVISVIQVKEAVIVEGKYDKIKLSSIIDGLIIETHGFQILKTRSRWPCCGSWLLPGPADLDRQ